MQKKIIVLTTNHHTPYTTLLGAIFEKVYCLNGLNSTQLDLNSPIIKISLLKCINILTREKNCLFIFNSLLRDFGLFLFALCLKKKIVIVVHGNILHGWGRFPGLFYIKRIFYQAAALCVGGNRIVTISHHAKRTLNIKNCRVILPFVELKSSICPTNCRLVLSSNNINRAHFDHILLYKLKETKCFEIHICGNGNTAFKNDFHVHEFSSRRLYFDFLKSCKFSINILKYPESNYNLSFLDCLSCGCIPVWCERSENEIPNYANINQIVKHSDFSGNRIFAKINFLINEANTKTLEISRDKFLDHFSKQRFENSWNFAANI